MDGEAGLSASRGVAADGRMAVTAFICGRGRVGKTVVANTLVQFCRNRGAWLEVWNSDR